MRTERLDLRQWREADRAPFAALNADPEVMAHFPSTLTTAESDAMVDRIEGRMAEDGFGLWAVEVIGGAPCIGFVGLAAVPFAAHFVPALEVGWRLSRASWGHGYAPEAARACLAYAFAEVVQVDERFVSRAVAGAGVGSRLEEAVSMTAVGNLKSRRVMEKIGMHRDPADDFDHPAMVERAPHLVAHVVYRIGRDEPTG